MNGNISGTKVSIVNVFNYEFPTVFIIKQYNHGIYLVDTYNPDVVTGTGSWIKEDICNAEVFIADFTTYRMDTSVRGGGVFICFTNLIVSTEL